MRLLDSKTLELHEFIGTQVPTYAILSHTWDEGEVSFQDMMSGDIIDKKGYDKIKQCCEVALSDGFKYAWVDTCCIDKTSSSELSEAINSMYRWYKEAAVCYVNLSDVPSNEDCHLESSAFRASRWFTRGWTLQEFLAPKSLVFFARDWKEIGTKASLRDLICKITKIHIGLLSGDVMLSEFSVAQKMSYTSHSLTRPESLNERSSLNLLSRYAEEQEGKITDSSVLLGASQRCTTRTEDLAYCLMGLFDVNMPLLYGEGSKSFYRLQEQIIRQSDDESIFAWSSEDADRRSFLATSPRDFIEAGDIIQTPNIAAIPFSLTNRGISMQTLLFRYQYKKQDRTLVVLNCRREGDAERLCVLGDESSATPGKYFRNTSLSPGTISKEEFARLKPKSIYMHIDPNASNLSGPATRMKYYVETRGLRENKISIVEIDHFPHSSSRGESKALWEWNQVGEFVGCLRFCNSTGRGFDIVLRCGINANLITIKANGTTRTSSREPIPAEPSQTEPGENALSHIEGSDRVWWHDPSESIWIKVTIRAQHIPNDEDESKTGDYGNGYKVDINWDEPGDSRVYDPINLGDLAISAGLLGDRRRPLKILIIAGGGLQAICNLLILDKLLDAVAKHSNVPHRKLRPCDVFDTIAGIGTGGWLAILLGRFHMDIATCLSEWYKIIDSIAPRSKSEEIRMRALHHCYFNPNRLVEQIDSLTKIYGTGNFLFDNRAGEVRTRHVFVAALRSNSSEYCLFRTYAITGDASFPSLLRDGPENPGKFRISQAFGVTGAAKYFSQPWNEQISKRGRVSFHDTTYPRPHNITELVLDEMWALYGSEVPLSVIVNIGPGLPTKYDVKQILQRFSWGLSPSPDSSQPSNGPRYSALDEVDARNKLTRAETQDASATPAPKAHLTRFPQSVLDQEQTRPSAEKKQQLARINTFGSIKVRPVSQQLIRWEWDLQREIKQKLYSVYQGGDELYYRLAPEYAPQGTVMNDSLAPGVTTDATLKFLKQVVTEARIDEIARQMS